MKVLVRAVNWLGDAVMAVPALREIRRVHRNDEVVVLARPWVADLYARVAPAVMRWNTEHLGKDIVCVAHGGINVCVECTEDNDCPQDEVCSPSGTWTAAPCSR